MRAHFVLCAGLAAMHSCQAQTYSILADFNYINKSPLAPLTQGSDGNLYGTTEKGNTYGTIFRMTPSGTLTTLYYFAQTDGSSPTGGVVFASDGNLWGTTNQGGSSSTGTIFKMSSAGSLTSVYSFGASTSDGSAPTGNLVQAGDGNLYGVTSGGGSGGCGTIYQITMSGTYTSKYSFTCSTDGGFPKGGMIWATDGNLYGTTSSGGSGNYGTAFRFSLGGTYTVLHAFGGSDGHVLNAGLIQATDGNFYGTTYTGGSAGFGTVFQLTAAGTLTTLHNFTGTDGKTPVAPLLQGADGNLYGTADGGGTAGYGTVFSLTPGGQFTLLHSFTGTDGQNPAAGLIEDPAGTLIGVTFGGGANNDGVVYSVTYSTSAPAINSNGVVPVYSTVPTIQPGEWVSIYGRNLANQSATWNNNFPTSLGGTTVTIGGAPAYLWYVNSSQINLQVPDDLSAGSKSVVVTTGSGSASSAVTVASQAPSFSLLDAKHVAAIILRSDGSGAYGGGTYDIVGPTGESLGYKTVAATAGDTVELFGVGFGATNPHVPAGQAYSGAAPTISPVTVYINGTAITPSFAGISAAGLYQLNVTVPSGLPTGDVSLQAAESGSQTPLGTVISLR
jgi:uncharacterized protein (TIGR03437 family)